jgi:hypothetical protein
VCICPDSARCPETGIDNVAGRRSGHKIDLLEGDFRPAPSAPVGAPTSGERVIRELGNLDDIANDPHQSMAFFSQIGVRLDDQR